jgi:hypothetical protein
VNGCICGHEAMLCRCGHPVNRHVIASGPRSTSGIQGTFVCPVHGCMERCQVCDCDLFKHGEPEDPRDFGLTAEDLRAVADRLYDLDDPRLEHEDRISERYGLIRSRLRSLADAIEETS